ncbi:hypothetical protein M0R45_009147 [Rubus argutus]|uniref:Uncharacterized protein n=1 Tax=Rubus argutus TaxID=59490 RepID=A0AAW1Y415_RUBAR
MLDLVHTRFLTYPPETDSQYFFVGISAWLMLLQDTRVTLVGITVQLLTSSSYMKVCGPVVPNPPSSLDRACKKKGWKMKAWIRVLVGCCLAFGFDCSGGWFVVVVLQKKSQLWVIVCSTCSF